MRGTGRRDLLISLLAGFVALLLFHLDHLVATYATTDRFDWWLHLLVDGSYIFVYGGLFWVMLRGWRRWKRSQ